MRKPTRSQLKVLAFICGFIEGKGESPTVREIMDGLGIKNIGTVQRALQGLERKGTIRRTGARSRNLVVLQEYSEFV